VLVDGDETAFEVLELLLGCFDERDVGSDMRAADDELDAWCVFAPEGAKTSLVIAVTEELLCGRLS
jgi:hypothetical protein